MIASLEKSKAFWYLIALLLLFFILRLPSLIEPNWYGDEGIYQVIGQALNNGRGLYAGIWDNKPPLLYLVYAIFNGDQFQVRFFSLLTGLVATTIFFYLSRLLFKQLKACITASISFAVLFGVPMLEGNIANAENFMILPILTAGLLVYLVGSKNQNVKFLILAMAGLLLGIAFLFKIVAVFDFAAFLVYLLVIGIKELRIRNQELWSQRKKLIPLIHNSLFIILGFIIPLLLTAIYFIAQNAFADFAKATFSSNVGYVGWKNNFIFPQGLLILKLILLASTVILLFLKRRLFSNSFLFIFLWFSFSLFNTYFSGRPYTHYVLVALSSFCLLIGLLFDSIKPKTRLIFLLILVCSIILLNKTFKFNPDKTFRYYGNAISFLTGKKSVSSYQSFFDDKTPRDYEIASFIKTHTLAEDTVFIWGDSAQIYAVSEKQPIGRYTVAYHITQYKNGLEETQQALAKTKPKYIITLKESRDFPFRVAEYDRKFAFQGGVIYERSL